jgi:3-phenylpropionate/trans-cinnamate dioxygenase ferredoxin reductase subunit
VPWFWSDQAGAKLQIAGLAAGADDAVVRPGARPGQQVVLRFRQERLVAAECVNAAADFLTVRSALAAGAVIDPDTVLRPGKLKDVLGSVTV